MYKNIKGGENMKIKLTHKYRKIDLSEQENVINKVLHTNKDYINKCMLDYMTFGAVVFNTNKLKV